MARTLEDGVKVRRVTSLSSNRRTAAACSVYASTVYVTCSMWCGHVYFVCVGVSCSACTCVCVCPYVNDRPALR